MSTGESDGFVSFLPVDAWVCRSATWLRLACSVWIAFCERAMSADTTGHRNPLSLPFGRFGFITVRPC